MGELAPRQAEQPGPSLQGGWPPPGDPPLPPLRPQPRHPGDSPFQHPRSPVPAPTSCGHSVINPTPAHWPLSASLASPALPAEVQV